MSPKLLKGERIPVKAADKTGPSVSLSLIVILTVLFGGKTLKAYVHSIGKKGET